MVLPRKGIIVCGLLFALAGCETPTSFEPSRETTARLEGRAVALLAEGRFADAAAEYTRLAEDATGPLRRALLLAAADAYVRDNDIERGRRLLDATPVADGEPVLALRRDLVHGRIALAENAPTRALELLPRDIPAAAPASVAAAVRELRSEAYGRTGNRVEAARERVALEFLLTDETAIRRNREALWDGIGRMTLPALEQVRIAPPDTLGGWLELAALVKRSGAEEDTFESALERWRERFPGHPATAEILPALVENFRLESTPPKQIALLLPLDGAFAAAAGAIRDGFLAAWFMDGRGADRPVVIIHDTAGRDVQALYREVVGNAAEFVVGPLQKEAVRALGELDELPVPVLALNRAASPGGAAPGADAPPTAGRGLYQFSLSPEAEAEQVAERAWFDGHVGAAVITPNGEWGERVASAFVTKWESLGGMVVEHQRYDNTATDMSEPVKSLLNVDDSEQRGRRLRRILGLDIEHEPRRRQDVDFIFMAAFPRQARLLRPQFKFHRASRVPVYATSHIYTGVADRDADRDVDGVFFADMPWVLNAPTGAPLLRERVRAVWPGAKSGYARFYAFGADAYRVLPQLRRLKAQPLAEFAGATGRLWVDQANHVRRRLTWARFSAGLPRLPE